MTPYFEDFAVKAHLAIMKASMKNNDKHACLPFSGLFYAWLRFQLCVIHGPI